MSNATPHKFHDAPVRLDELEPFGEITMSTKTYEHLTGHKLVDSTLPVRGEPGAISRSGRPITAEATLPADSENPATEPCEDAEPPSVPEEETFTPAVE